MKEDCKYIIDDVCTTERTNKLVRKIISILVSWAKKGEIHHTYKDLNLLLGYKDGIFSRIGRTLGRVEDVLAEFREKSGENVPILNALVNSKTRELPSNGFSYIYPNYEDMDKREKEAIADYENSRAVNYKNWDWVLSSLGLKPRLNEEDEEKIRSSAFGYGGGEGEEHKKIKEYIARHPESIGLHGCGEGITEHILLSGDRLDVYFPDKNIAVEVKPKSSPDADILRGIFQCVKYKSVLDAEAEVKGEKPSAKTMLVCGGKLSKSNMEVQKCLNINVVEKFTTKD